MSNDRPNLNVLQGDRIDPGDVDDSDEELEALSIRMREDLQIIDQLYDPLKKLDQTILKLRNGINIIELLAESGHSGSIPEVFERSIKAYIDRVQHGAPQTAYEGAIDDDVNALKLLNEAMFLSHMEDFKRDYPSEAWSDNTVADTVFDGLAQAAAALRIICPQEQEEPAENYNKRLRQYLPTVCEELLNKRPSS